MLPFCKAVAVTVAKRKSKNTLTQEQKDESSSKNLKRFIHLLQDDNKWLKKQSKEVFVRYCMYRVVNASVSC